MKSFLASPPLATLPLQAAASLGAIDLGRGREELHLTQAPQVLARLAESAKVASITASNAIENVIVDDERALALIRAPDETSYESRTEQEFAGYRDASDYLMRKTPEALTVGLLLHLHRLLMQHTGDPLAGRFKSSDNFIGERRPDGTVTTIFKTVPAGEQTEWHIQELIARYEAEVSLGTTPRPILVALLVLDFLAIHPFQDGNGRIARLLTTCELLRHGYGVARYASLEQRIYDAKNSYYESLKSAQRDWHDGVHDPTRWLQYLLTIIEGAYVDFEERVIAGRSLDGKSKSEQVTIYVMEQAPATFRFVDVEAALPDVSAATIRLALKALADDGKVEAGRGRSAQWRRLTTAP